MHINKDLRGDRDRADAQRDTKKHREHRPVGAVGDERVRQQQSPRDSEAHWDQQPGEADSDDGQAAAAHQPDVHVHPGETDQQNHAELTGSVKQMELVSARRQQPAGETGRERAEQGRPEQHAGEQFAYHGGHCEPRCRPAQEMSKPEQHRDLEQEDEKYLRRQRGHRTGRVGHHHSCQEVRAPEDRTVRLAAPRVPPGRVVVGRHPTPG